MLWASVGVLSVFSSKWVGNGLLGKLERQYSIVSVETVTQADVIVVLGGTTVPALVPRVEVEVTEACLIACCTVCVYIGRARLHIFC